MTRSTGTPCSGHALEDDAGVEGGAFDGGEELVLRGVQQVPAEGDAAELRVDEHGAVAVVPGEAQQAGLAGLIGLEALRQIVDVGAGASAMASKMSPMAESPASMPVKRGWTLPGTTPQTPGMSSVFAAMAMMQVEVPTTLTTSPSRQPAPMASQWASKAPTGMGMPARRPSCVGPSLARGAGDGVGGLVIAAELFADAVEEGIEFGEERPAAADRPSADSTSICGPWRRRCA